MAGFGIFFQHFWTFYEKVPQYLSNEPILKLLLTCWACPLIVFDISRFSRWSPPPSLIKLKLCPIYKNQPQKWTQHPKISQIRPFSWSNRIILTILQFSRWPPTPSWITQKPIKSQLGTLWIWILDILH